jgi:NAD(P)-dependent dehydrogenase (short-subunit alcohol dehydrogenase family)
MMDAWTRVNTRFVMDTGAQRRILITGGATGIGQATALLAAQKGYAVAINFAHSDRAARDLVSQIEALGQAAVAVKADIAEEEEVVRMFETMDRELGPIDALVNNAAHMDRQMRLDEMSRTRIAKTFSINVIGAFMCAREAVRRMSSRHGGAGGAIVNVSSGAARFGSPGEYIDYASSKGAIETMTLGLAREVAEEKVRVNAVPPGFIDTGLHAKTGEPNRVERVRHLVPMKRVGTPQEVAHAILWLASSEASYVTGAIVDVSGGR